MKLSRYLIHVPYRLAWWATHLSRRLRNKPQGAVFYCCSAIDYVAFKNVHKHLPGIRLVAESAPVRRELELAHGIKDCGLYPAFPDVVIMARHEAWKFPGRRPVKIGMRHGAYHFKTLVAAAKYNKFDRFLLTSQHECDLATAAGIVSAVAVGFPKLDEAFDGTLTRERLNHYRSQLNLDERKPTILFTSTWDESHQSAVAKWAHRLGELTERYNILVTLHPWISERYADVIRQTDGVHYLRSFDNLPYLMISDLMVADTSSIIAEFCALDKPIVTYRIEQGPRLSRAIQDMLAEISYPVDSFEEMKLQVARALENPGELSAARRKYSRMMFDELDGKAGERAAAVIREFLQPPAGGA